jgi:hypothetical protein
MKLKTFNQSTVKEYQVIWWNIQEGEMHDNLRHNGETSFNTFIITFKTFSKWNLKNYIWSRDVLSSVSCKDKENEEHVLKVPEYKKMYFVCVYI